MTIETQTNRAQFVGNGVTTEFPVLFPVLQPYHLRLFLREGDSQTEMTEGFTVIGAGTAAVSVRTVSPIPAGVKLTILREVPLKQEMDLMNGGPFNAEKLEGSADIIVMQIQQLAERSDRSFQWPESETPPYQSAQDYLNIVKISASQAQSASTEAKTARDEAVAAEAFVAANAAIAVQAATTAASARDTAVQSAATASAAATSAAADADRTETAAAGVQDAVDAATGLSESLGWLPWKQAINSCRFTRSAINQAMRIFKLQTA